MDKKEEIKKTIEEHLSKKVLQRKPLIKFKRILVNCHHENSTWLLKRSILPLLGASCPIKSR